MQFIIIEPENTDSQLKTPHSHFIALINKSQHAKLKLASLTCKRQPKQFLKHQTTSNHTWCFIYTYKHHKNDHDLLLWSL